MKYEEMIKNLRSYRMIMQDKYRETFYECLNTGMLEFGKVYIYPAVEHQGITGNRHDEYYGINIREKLWLFIEPLLRNAFNIEKLNEHAYTITLK